MATSDCERTQNITYVGRTNELIKVRKPIEARKMTDIAAVGQETSPSQGNQSSCDGASGPFDHPVYKKLAIINGEINKMTKHQMVEKLAQLNLDTRGLKDVLKKRLKNYYRRKNLTNAKVRSSSPSTPRYSRFLVIDFEATCDREASNYPHEIIEFPIVLLDTVNRVVIDEFHSFVRPTVNPHLSAFCTELTGITQSQVNAAPTFPEVLQQVEKWMETHQLGSVNKFAVVTDGPWDMSRFMYLQCLTSAIMFPQWARKWINVRKAFCNKYRTKKASVLTMLECFGLAFEGQQHSGIADARNIVRIAIQMLEDGCVLNVNERIKGNQLDATNSCSQFPKVQSVPRDEASSGDEDNTNVDSDVLESSDINRDEDDAGATVDSCQTLNDATRVDDKKCERENSELEDCSDLLHYLALQNS